MTGKINLFGGNPLYRGAVSDHYDGERFFAPEPVPRKSLFSVLKWRLTAQRQAWPKWVEIETDHPPAWIMDRDLRVSFVNHATILLQTGGMNILTDPVWSRRCSPVSFLGPKRVHVPGIAWDDLPKIDLVLISHAHYDHLDLRTVKNLVARDNPVLIVPPGVDTLIRRVAPQARIQMVDWGQSVASGAATIHAEPTQHWSARSPFDYNRSLWSSYILDFGGRKIYFSGDTGYASGRIFKEIGRKYHGIHFAMIGIGAYEPRWFMHPAHIAPFEAVQIFKDIGATYAMPMHFGTFQLSDEGRDQPVTDLHAALDAAGISREMFRVLQPGQHWVVPEA